MDSLSSILNSEAKVQCKGIKPNLGRHFQIIGVARYTFISIRVFSSGSAKKKFFEAGSEHHKKLDSDLTQITGSKMSKMTVNL